MPVVLHSSDLPVWVEPVCECMAYQTPFIQITGRYPGTLAHNKTHLHLSAASDGSVETQKMPSGLLGLLRAQLSLLAAPVNDPIALFCSFLHLSTAGAERFLSSLIHGCGLGDLCTAQRVLHLIHTALRKFYQIRCFTLLNGQKSLVMNEWMNHFGLCLPVLKKIKK